MFNRNHGFMSIISRILSVNQLNHGSNTDSNVDISPFTRDNYIHGHHSSTTSCLHFVCVCNKSDLIGTLASVIVLTGQTCGDCHLFQVHQHIVLLGFIPSLSPYFIWSFEPDITITTVKDVNAKRQHSCSPCWSSAPLLG